jgi:hypothetical protein
MVEARGRADHGFWICRAAFEVRVKSKEDTMAKQEVIYAKFETMEEQVAHCYFLLHEHFIANPPLAKFWVEAAMDELQHNSILRFCRERGLMLDLDIDHEAIEKVEQLLETVKSIVSDPEVTVEEAFYASLLLETSELDEVYQKLTGALATDHPLLHQAIQASLRTHMQGFVEGAERFCADRGFVDAFRKILGRSSS